MPRLYSRFRVQYTAYILIIIIIIIIRAVVVVVVVVLMESGVAWWLRCCATSRTVPGSIPGGFTMDFPVTYSLLSS